MSEDSTFTPPEVIHGDCIVHMAAMAAAGRRFSSVVTDPPYGLSFMNAKWDAPDNVAFRPETWRLALDVLEPGGMLAAFGGARTQHRMACAIEDAGFQIFDTVLWLYGSGFPKAKTQLKPAYEPIILARKPTKGPLRALGIDVCRVACAPGDYSTGGNNDLTGTGWGHKDTSRTEQHPAGRWPANILHDGSDEVLEAFAVFGTKTSGKPGIKWGKNDGAAYGAESRPPGTQMGGFGDSGSAARFFYQAKASKLDRCDSKHPTIKPISLMRWLVRLITPPGGKILDPFAGSGTTLAAAHMEGFHAVGIEQEAEYVADCRRRIDALTTAAQPAIPGGFFTAQDAAE